MGLEKFFVVLPSWARPGRSFLLFWTTLQEILIDLDRTWNTIWTITCLWWTMSADIMDDIILVGSLEASYVHRIFVVAGLCSMLEWCCDVWHILAYSIRCSLASIGHPFWHSLRLVIFARCSWPTFLKDLMVLRVAWSKSIIILELSKAVYIVFLDRPMLDLPVLSIFDQAIHNLFGFL